MSATIFSDVISQTLTATSTVAETEEPTMKVIDALGSHDEMHLHGKANSLLLVVTLTRFNHINVSFSILLHSIDVICT